MDSDTQYEQTPVSEAATEFDATHLMGFSVAEDEPDAADAGFIPLDEDGQEIMPDAPPEHMPRSAFTAVWTTAWNIPGMMMPDYRPLQITDDKKPASDEAADAIYDLALEHFPGLISQNNATMGAVMRILPFGMIQAGAVRAILIEKRKARQSAPEGPQATFASQRAQKPANTPENPPQAHTAPEGGVMNWMDEERAA